MVICPKCRSDRTAPILYGYPSHEAFEAEERGELILGGCEMIDGMPHEDYGCLDCRYRWSKELLPATQITKNTIQGCGEWSVYDRFPTVMGV